MNVEAYKVSVRIALEDQITRGMAAMGADILNLDEKVKVLEQSLKHLTTTARSAQKALKNIAVGAGDPFTAAKQNADDYAKKLDDIQERSRAASKAISERPVGIPPAVLGGALLISNNAIAERAASASSHGDGRGGGGGLSITPSHAGGPGYDPLRGWQNGVPPGGWGSGGAGGGSGGGNRGGGGRPEFSHSDAFTNLAIGYGGFKLLGGFVDEASKYQIATEKFKQFNMGDAALKEAEKFAASQHISGTSQREMLLKLVEAQGVFRQHNSLAAAEMAAPIMAKMAFASQGLDPHLRAATEAKEMDMLRFVETAGGLKSPERFNQLMDSGFKAIQSSGGNVDFTQYRQFMSKGGTAAMGLTDKALFAEMEPIIGELKGGAAGDALMTAYNRLNGIIKLPNQVAHELVKNKIWDGSQITWNSQGGIKHINGNPLINSKQFAESPVEWYEHVMLPIYQKQHLTEDQIHRQNAMIFGRTGSKMFNLIDKQLATIHHSEEMFDQARGMQGAYEAIQKTYAGRAAILDTKWKDFKLAMGRDGGLLDLATEGLNLLADSLDRVTKFAKRHPELTKLSVEAIAAISGLAMLSGGIFVLGHAASTLLKTFQLLRWTMELLAGKKELQLAKALTGVSDNALLATRALTVLTRWLGIIGLFVPTNNTPNTTEELAEKARASAVNLPVNMARWAKEHPGVPFPDTGISPYDVIKNRAKWMKDHHGAPYPESGESPYIRPNKGQPLQVHTDISVDGRPLAKVVTHHQAKEAQRSARSTTSTFDPTMTPPTVALGR
ncbi:Uncharacterised protein [Serratia proteamaculans]|uniref:hypothetical protein n=1 Tax=Serratia proteamaculans TaxID=28151 RepID=UPI0021835FC0|nr:hypothetical protein [Serratia proteamaculans]CAI2428153.1 Uncharacterised protein [Serratia proteamaculans]